MACPISASGIAIATNSIANTKGFSSSTECGSRAKLPMGSTSRSANWPIIPGSWAASSIPSSSRSPWNRILCSGPSSARPWSIARSGAAGLPSAPKATKTFRWRRPGRLVRITSQLEIGGGAPLALIAGPCVIESEEHVCFLAGELSKLGAPFVFKASFDKANRSSMKSYRGPGLKEGLRILRSVRARGIPVLTDIHDPSQAAPAAEAVDILQIPAFLCRQTDLLVEAGRTGKVVNIKKGQFVSPHDIRLAAEKVASTGNNRVLLTERGSSFGYNNLVVDMRGLPIMRGFGFPVVFDATHSVQLPGAAGIASGGQPEFIEPLASAAVAAGADAVFLEVHEAPERALSDGANALKLDKLAQLWAKLQRISAAARVV